MNVVGIVAEYNPFHNGHYYHLTKAKEVCKADFTIAVMSGNFVQRGEPAIFNKWLRAKMAVECGIDLVLELPVVFALRSAQFFAAGAARLLDNLGIVTHLAFGAENSDITLLKQYADIFFSETALKQFYENLDNGLNYAKALGQAVKNNVHNDSLNFSPNNILAIEYLRAIKRYNLSLKPIVIKREGAAYHEEQINTLLASATAIRHEIINNSLSNKAKNAIPAILHNTYQEALTLKMGPVFLEQLAKIILYQIRLQPAFVLQNISDVSEGLENVLKREALRSSSVNELIHNTKSKRYTYTRLQRILMHIILETDKQFIFQCDQIGPLYGRVLAFNDNGRILLKEISAKSSIPIITKLTKFLNAKQRYNPQNLLQKMLSHDTLATDIYNLCVPNSILASGAQDFVCSPIYLSY